MRRFRRFLKPLAYTGVIGGTLGFGTLQFLPKYFEKRKTKLSTGSMCGKVANKFNSPLPSRHEQLNTLIDEEFDVLVIGGGATGCGVALDAASRGLKTALVEKYDFSSGTSSRSTKLVHGGVRYLQKAVFSLDSEQFNMVLESLSERANVLRIAPHLATEIPIMLPLYKWWQIPYFWAGIKMYDIISRFEILKASYFLNKTQALEKFPMLKRDNLKGALVYYDGQQNDARMCVSLALTAARYGAVVANYVEVTSLTKDHCDRVNGAVIKNLLNCQTCTVKAKCVINATGPFTDSIRNMDCPSKQQICQPSCGVHIVLPGYYSPDNMGLLEPKTSDGRVIFFLPWLNSTIAGTTDDSCGVTHEPCPNEKDIQFILEEIRRYISTDIKVRRGDVNSAWCGIRPLVKDPNSKNTQSIARNHIIEISESGLITIAGGKWTTYRSMAEETVDKIFQVTRLPFKESVTKGLLLEGAHGWHPNLFIALKQEYGLDTAVAKHLASMYGTKSLKIARMAELTGERSPVVGRRLHPEYPFIEAEVRWACREYTLTAVDMIAYRLRLAFLDACAADAVLPRVIDIMGNYYDWTDEEKEQEMQDAKDFLNTQMGLGLKESSQNVPINFTDDEIKDMMQRFENIDRGNKGFLTVSDLKRYLKADQENITDAQLMEILLEVNTRKNGEIDQNEFLQFMSALKTGAIAQSGFKQIVYQETSSVEVNRSGGGV